MSSLFTTLEIASSGMKAQRTRMNVAAMNMANKNTTRSVDGGVYRRRDVVLEACLLYTSPSPRDATLSRMPSSA